MIKRFKSNAFILLGFILIAGDFLSFSQEEPSKIFVQNPTISNPFKETQSEILTFKDSLSAELLFLHRSDKQIPLYYTKNIKSEVCFDKECRLLDIYIYWNITGRYLGFETPKGEFLSKYDHEPFTEVEYLQLNELLANPSLPFGNISFDELVTIKDSKEGEIDGVSGATNPNIEKMVVKGAAYTTYKLWNIISCFSWKISSD